MIALPEIRLVVEKVEPYMDGRDRYQVGYEHASYTNLGWVCDSPEQGFLRVLNDEQKHVINLAEGVIEGAAVITALATEISRRFGTDLTAGVDWPSRHVVASEFGATRIQQVEAQRNEWQKRLTDGHRCPHHRTCLDSCFQCPNGHSIGGAACSFDDKRFWVDFANGK